jgi:hypothetical protein
MTEPTPFTRRRMIAGTLGAGLGTAAIFQIGRAQTGTPEASPTTDTTTGTGDDTTAEITDRATTAIEWATETITAAQGDRDTVAGQIDVTTVDSLLTQATGLRDRAQQAADGADEEGALRLAFASWGTANAAGDLIKAQLTYTGLPSQQAPSSRVLANAYEMVQAVSDETASATDTDVTFSVSTAQALYASAYELYSGGAFAQATATARAGTGLARVAWFLASDEEMIGVGRRRGVGIRDIFAGPGGPDLDRHGRGDLLLPGHRIVTEEIEAIDRGEPVTVPEPEF